MKVLSPQEAFAMKKKQVPDCVIECWNAVVVKHLKKGIKITSSFTLEELTQYMESVLPENRNQMLENGWFDIEEHFRDNGWSVEFDKPAYNEDYPAKFILREK